MPGRVTPPEDVVKRIFEEYNSLSRWETAKLNLRAAKSCAEVAASWVSMIPLGVELAWGYNTDKSVTRHSYGDHSRQILDLYLPDENSPFVRAHTPAPVVLFIHGGGWWGGDHRHYYKMCKQLSSWGCVVISATYRLHPEVQAPQMIDDIQGAVDWTAANVSKFGGDSKNVTLVAHSAGAHLTSCLITRQAKSAATARDFSSKISGCVLMCGVYNVLNHLEHERARSLHHLSPLTTVVGGDYDGFLDHSPFYHFSNPKEAESCSACFSTPGDCCGLCSSSSAAPTTGLPAARVCPKACAELPPVLLLHGTDDDIVPYSGTLEFSKALSTAGVTHRVKVYEEFNHSDLVMGLFDKEDDRCGVLLHDLFMHVLCHQGVLNVLEEQAPAEKLGPKRRPKSPRRRSKRPKRRQRARPF